MKKIIDIRELIISPSNYRFDPVDTEEQAIDLMLDNKGAEILKIAEHIVKKGLDEAKDIRVIKSSSKYLVLDGNRRVTAIKCLLNPKFAKDASLREGFLRISKEFRKVIPQKINCFEYLTEEESSEWIRLDHTGKNEGVGQDPWGSAEQDRFDERFGGKLSLAMQAVDLLKTRGIIINTKKAKITTINRLFSDPIVREFMGIDKVEGNLRLTTSEEEAIRRIKQVFDEVIDNDLRVRQVYEKTDRERFVKNTFASKPPFLKTGPVPPPEVINELRKRPIPISRDTLIPRDCIIRINQSRLNQIYHELKSISLNAYVNAVAVLFRVFLEGSLDHYLETKNISIRQNPMHDPSLAQKLGEVARGLQLNRDEQKIVNKAIASRDTIYSIDTFNAYIHNAKLHPSPSELKNTWNDFQPIMEKIWAALETK